MAIPCPHCGGPYFSCGQVFANGARVSSAAAPLKCASCGGLSFVPLNGSNAAWALVVLAVGIVASYPSAISDSYVSLSSSEYKHVLRADVWALAVMAAYVTFAFAGRLRKFEGREARSSRRWTSFATLVGLGAVLFYGYFLFRG